MNRFQRSFVLLVLAPAVLGGSHLLGESATNDQVEAAAAAVLGLAEAGWIPAPARLQVLRLPANSTQGELPPWGDPALTTAVMAHLGGNTRNEGPSLATCEEARSPAVGVDCRFPEGIPVGVRVESVGAERGVVIVVILDATDDPGMPLDVTAYRVSVSRAPSGLWRFGGILSEEPAQVNWRALAHVEAASPGLGPR